MMTGAPRRNSIGEISLLDVQKNFSGVIAVRGVSLNIGAGEFFSLLGSSGSGKTTILRMIGGFERPTGGKVLIDGLDVTDAPAHRRNVNTVFQSYALFPHLNVFENVAFGLRRARVEQHEIGRRVGEALELVQLSGLHKRMPAQMSGGQQQRVALARALVLRPSVLLLDEPLGALDAKLRKQLQIELKALQQTVGITFVYVTHDQEEALAMSDRIAIMAEGQVLQVATPVQAYDEPASLFVAEFLGTSNLLAAHAKGGTDSGRSSVEVSGKLLTAQAGDTAFVGPVKLAIRPERVRLEPAGSIGTNRLSGAVERKVFYGDRTQLLVRLDCGETICAVHANSGAPPPFGPGDRIEVHLPQDSLRVFGTPPN